MRDGCTTADTAGTGETLFRQRGALRRSARFDADELQEFANQRQIVGPGPGDHRLDTVNVAGNFIGHDNAVGLVRELLEQRPLRIIRVRAERNPDRWHRFAVKVDRNILDTRGIGHRELDPTLKITPAFARFSVRIGQTIHFVDIALQVDFQDRVDVRAFNTPPRFSPVRVSNIAVNESFSLQIQAIDPEEPSSSLIRYLGVDLPEGASINEETGLFSWTPSPRQVGEFTFRVIASDQLGAASSQDITLTVLDISRGDGN